MTIDEGRYWGLPYMNFILGIIDTMFNKFYVKYKDPTAQVNTLPTNIHIFSNVELNIHRAHEVYTQRRIGARNKDMYDIGT